MILAIDPGTTHSGIVVIDEKQLNEKGAPKIIDRFKLDNQGVLDLIFTYGTFDQIVIEMIASYGMAVGQTTFETCVWIGKFMLQAEILNIPVTRVFRKDIKLHICNNGRAKDTNVKQALIDRFANEPNVNHGKGKKAFPDYFYGFKSDIWQAFAVGIYFMETKK